MYYFERYTLIHVPVTTIFFKTEKKREEREKRQGGRGRKKNREERRGEGRGEKTVGVRNGGRKTK